MLAAVLAWPSPAVADQTVVSATVYPSSGGDVGHRSVNLSTLQSCPLFSGPNPIYLYPGQSPYQWATDSTWTVATVAQCALGIPPSVITGVQVRSPSQGYESLSGSDLTDPASFDDPLAPGALPTISSEPGEDLNTYFRPWRGGADDNARDKVTEFGAPVSLVIFENGTPLTVSITSKKAGATSVTLSATASDAHGDPVPVTALRWGWDFGDGSTSNAAAPTQEYAPGRYIITLQVTDSAAGTGGTATTTVTIGSHAGTGAHQPGGGSANSGPPNGPAHSSRNHSGGPAGVAKGSGSHTSGHNHSSTPAPSSPTTGALGSHPLTSPTTSTVSTPTTPSRATKSPTATHPRSDRPARSRVPPSAPLVTGRLISYVTPVPPAASPLVHLLPASVASSPAARRALTGSPLPGPAAALVIVLLFGLGAGRELRGRRDRRAFRFGG